MFETYLPQYIYQSVFLLFTSRMTIMFNPLPDDKILDRSSLKRSADDNFKFDENSRKFSKRVENTVGKGEIAHNKKFLLFPQCFQKACFLEASKVVIMWEWVNLLPNNKFLDWSKLKAHAYNQINVN